MKCVPMCYNMPYFGSDKLDAYDFKVCKSVLHRFLKYNIYICNVTRLIKMYYLGHMDDETQSSGIFAQIIRVFLMLLIF